MSKYRTPPSLDPYGDSHLPIGRDGLVTKKRSPSTSSGEAKKDATSTAGTSKTRGAAAASSKDKKAEQKAYREDQNRQTKKAGSQRTKTPGVSGLRGGVGGPGSSVSRGK
jgi:hypothetical protein